MFTKPSLKRWVLFFLLTLSPILFLDVSTGQVRFEKPINLSDHPSNASMPNIAAVADQVFVVWRDDRRPGPFGDILLAHSRDEGVAFRSWNLSEDFKFHHGTFPDVVSDGNNIYVGWVGQLGADVRTGAPLLARSLDGGQSFQPPFDWSGRGAFGVPVMRLQDGGLYIAWAGYDQNSGFYDALFSKSTDEGQTFSEPVTVSELAQGKRGVSGLPALALDGDRVYMAWLGGRKGFLFYEIYFARSTDGGKTFSAPVSLLKRTRQGELALDPQLAISDRGYVYAAWTQGEDRVPILPADIYFSRSTDGGQTFSEPLNLSTNPQASNMIASMAAAGDKVYVLWHGLLQGGPPNTFFCRSTDGGQTFSRPQNISNSWGGSVAARMAILTKRDFIDQGGSSEDIIYLVWQDGARGNAEIFFSVSLDSGITFSEPEDISNNPSYSMGPRLAAVGENVYITWTDDATGNWNIFFSRGRLELNNKRR